MEFFNDGDLCTVIYNPFQVFVTHFSKSDFFFFFYFFVLWMLPPCFLHPLSFQSHSSHLHSAPLKKQKPKWNKELAILQETRGGL